MTIMIDVYQDLQFAQHERDSLIGHLVGRQQNKDTQLVLTPRQRQALEEEARLRLSNQNSFSTQNSSPTLTSSFLSQNSGSSSFSSQNSPSTSQFSSQNSPSTAQFLSQSQRNQQGGRNVFTSLQNNQQVGNSFSSILNSQGNSVRAEGGKNSLRIIKLYWIILQRALDPHFRDPHLQK